MHTLSRTHLRRQPVSLMTYGIPADLLPVGVDGEIIKRRNHYLEWVNYRKTLEEYETTGQLSTGLVEISPIKPTSY
jgi:hypothetical protein